MTAKIVTNTFVCLTACILNGCSQGSSTSNDIEGLPGLGNETSFDNLTSQVADLQNVLDDANRLWESGERDAAVEKYVVVLNNPLDGAEARWDNDPEGMARARAMAHIEGRRVPELTGLPTAYNRTIDHLVVNGAAASARPLIQQALKKRINLVLSSPEANDVLAEETRRREQELAEAREWLASENGGGSGGNGNADQMLSQIQTGQSKSQVQQMLGAPNSRAAIGLGEAWLYYVSETEAVFIAFDKRGAVISANKQDRN